MKPLNLSWHSRSGRLMLVIFAGAAATALLFVMAPGRTSGAPTPPTPSHGISFAKGCNSPSTVGGPYTCHFVILNSILVDTVGDTLTINSIVDTVHAIGGDVVSANLLPSAALTYAGGASCNVGQTLCSLPTGSSIVTGDFTLYTPILSTDPNPLQDDATLKWNDTCTGTSANCNTANQAQSAGSQSVIQTQTPTVTNTPTNTPTATKTPIVIVDTATPPATATTVRRVSTATNVPTVAPTTVPTVVNTVLALEAPRPALVNTVLGIVLPETGSGPGASRGPSDSWILLTGFAGGALLIAIGAMRLRKRDEG